MKHLLLTTIAAVLLEGCGESQESAPSPEAKPVEPVAEAVKPEPPPESSTAKAPDISILDAAGTGNIEAVKQHLDASADVNAKNRRGQTPLHNADTKGIAEPLIAKGANVNALILSGPYQGKTPLDGADNKEIANLIRKHGGKMGEELKAEGK